MQAANLIEEGISIDYVYDHERLVEIHYPENTENNVKYTYGEPGASDNRAGRIVIQEDGSGAQEFFYGPLGEVIKNIRTVVIPQHDEQTYTTEWQYDTWNRLTSMTYPDGEKVTYNYNSGGLLRSMTGKKKGTTFNYVNQLGYDKFEQRVYLEYGNGTKTHYEYEPDRRRLHNMTAQTKAKRLFMDNVYTYDKVNNIKVLENKAPIPSSNLMGGSSTYNYDYDDLYRLTTAEGAYKGSNEEHSYTLSMDYNSVGGITQKTQVHKKGDQEQKKTTYDLAYAYGETQPNAPIHIGDQSYTYDANGNQTGWTSDISGQQRKIMWDEENRIRSIYDNGSQHHYIYDAAGERVLKGKSTGQRIFVNGEWKAGSGQMGNYTVYVNPYLVLKSGGYTKHYYIESQRIVSKLGGGWDNKNAVKAGGNKVDYVGKTQKVFDGIVKNLKFLGADGQILTAGKSGKVPPGQVSQTGNVSEAFRYFYHPDHLGSTSYVTDASGEVYQHLEYFAFGETFVEEHSNTDRTPYLFNGKELDEETGLYYYGARYYDARVSVFQSVDPRADDFPSLSPYSYAANNPVIFRDENGEGPGPGPLTTAGLKSIANSLGVYGNKRTGELFERIAISAVQSKFLVTHNTSRNFESQARAARTGGSPSAVRPDGIGLSKRVGGIADIQGDKNSFYEAKATSATITRAYREGQMEGMIDVLASRMKNSNVKIAVLTLLTTSDTKVSQDLLDYASKRRVTIYQSKAAVGEDGNIYFSDLDRLNDVPGKDHSVEDFLNFFDMDNYDTFQGQNPKGHAEKVLKTPQANIGDPDPAQVDN